MCAYGMPLCAQGACTCVKVRQVDLVGRKHGAKAERKRRGGNVRVREVPAEVALCEGSGRLEAGSQRHAVDVSARPGTETGVEIIRHAVRTGDAAGETNGEKRHRVILHF